MEFKLYNIIDSDETYHGSIQALFFNGDGSYTIRSNGLPAVIDEYVFIRILHPYAEWAIPYVMRVMGSRHGEVTGFINGYDLHVFDHFGYFLFAPKVERMYTGLNNIEIVYKADKALNMGETYVLFHGGVRYALCPSYTNAVDGDAIAQGKGARL